VTETMRHLFALRTTDPVLTAFVFFARCDVVGGACAPSNRERQKLSVDSNIPGSRLGFSHPEAPPPADGNEFCRHSGRRVQEDHAKRSIARLADCLIDDTQDFVDEGWCYSIYAREIDGYLGRVFGNGRRQSLADYLR
jgi:hypothetical protein